MHIDLEVAAANTGGTLFPYSWDVMVCVPEPVSIGLFALGGLGLLRRRPVRRIQSSPAQAGPPRARMERELPLHQPQERSTGKQLP